MDDQSLEDLVRSIRQNGILQPVLVRPLGSNYQLVAGERRLTAAQRAGLLKIPAVVRSVPDDKLLELALVENIQREQLNPIEEAQAYRSLVGKLELTQEALAERLGKERSTIANAMRLLKLPSAVLSLVEEGSLTPGHARALLASGVPAEEMSRLARTIVEKSWSVRETERWARKQGVPKAASGVDSRAADNDPDLDAAVDRLRLILGTKVQISGGRAKRSGQIKIHYYSQEDLMRIYDVITRGSASGREA